eukprot:scaffold25992_cov23-Cyclotella_meneghiniana.AAC.3
MRKPEAAVTMDVMAASIEAAMEITDSVVLPDEGIKEGGMMAVAYLTLSSMIGPELLWLAYRLRSCCDGRRQLWEALYLCVACVEEIRRDQCYPLEILHTLD